MPDFRLVSDYKPPGDQPQAIAELAEGVLRGDQYQTLLGVTGSGKTFTMANVVAAADRPTLVIAHNKTLAAQLYGEFKDLFPENAVEYFVSYYDYYQPEAYVPSSDTYIEKDSSINDEIERMRHSATHSLRTRNDVLIVASVSCIYGLGTARVYVEMAITVERGSELGRDRFLRRLVECQYERNDADFHRGTFRVRGDTVEVFPAYEEDRALRIQFFGDQVEQITEFDPLRGISLSQLDKVVIFPGSHYVTEEEQRRNAILGIREELGDRLRELKGQNKLVEAQRLEQRTLFDLEMIEQLGFCNGIENYSRHLSGRAPGEAPRVCSTTTPETCSSSSTKATRRSRRLARCFEAIAPAKRRWWSSGFVSPPPWTIARSSFMSSSRWCRRQFSSPPLRPSTSCRRVAG